jgi:hypothetical protein
MSGEDSELNVETTSPQFSVNTRKLRADMNLLTPLDFTIQARDNGRQTVMQGIARYGREGDFLGDLRNPGDRMGQLARSRVMSEMLRRREFNIGLLPRDRPEMHWDTGSININWSQHRLSVDWDGNHNPQLTVDPYNVDVYIQNQPYFRITVEEVRLGLHVDQLI